jgi:glutamate--cysteine ligase catalytic subunit
LIECDEETKTSHVSIHAEKLLDALGMEMRARIPAMEKSSPSLKDVSGFSAAWHPEYGRYMMESTPAIPYRHDVKDLLCVERDMIARRKQAEVLLKKEEYLVTMGNFPRLGCPDSFADENLSSLTNEASKSRYFPDEFINTHPRFKTLTRNIRKRRGEKVCIQLPLFKDKATRPIETIRESALFPDELPTCPAKEDYITLDAMGFGMGCCCLQITFQARGIPEARQLYDQLAVMCPIVMALTASTPIYRGYLSDVDCRWNVISTSVDDRTREERGLDPDGDPLKRIPKSRYASISRYISQDDRLRPKYNDLKLPMNMACFERLLEAGFDERLASHFAWLFVRDPLVVYSELIEQDSARSSDHFENIQSTNWQTMRFKPPTADNHEIGWRVEFRPMEVQPTDFENAAFSVFVVLLTRVIVAYKLNFYMPISQVDVNMERAQGRDSVNKQRFYFPKDLYSDDHTMEGDIQEMSINTIINGDDSFPGLVPLIDAYLDSINVELDTRKRLSEYMQLISKRASGELLTPASWIRRFVLWHPDYQCDSIVSPSICHDLIRELDRIVHASQTMSSVNFCCHYSKTEPCK